MFATLIGKLTISSMILCNRPSLAKKYAGRAPNSLKVCEKLCAPTQLKSTARLKANLKKTTGGRKSGLPAHQIVILLILLCGANLREGSINSLITCTLASLRAKILEVMANMDREFIIHSYKKFWSRIEAVVDASGDFMK